MTDAALQPRTDQRAIERFLSRLHLPEGQLLEIRRVIPDTRGARSEFCSSVAEALDVVGRWSGVGNVYIGACPRSERHGRGSSVKTVTAAWADIDFHSIDSSNRERAEHIARQRIDAFSRRPTILVHSGNGLQSWWLYEQPVPISESWPAERFEAFNRGLARTVGGDTVHDLARVLRVPGTWNLPDAKKRSRGCVPVLARLLWADGPTHDPTHFSGTATEKINRQAVGRVISQPVPPTDEIVAAFRGLLTQLGPKHMLVRTWHGDRVLTDPTRSGWDMALVNQLVRVGVRAEFIPTIVRAYPIGRGVFATDDYIRRTLDKARPFAMKRDGTPRAS